MNKSILSLAIATSLALTNVAVQAHGDEEKSTARVQPVKTLTSILASMPDEAKARYDARHPQQTIEFFDIKPGMTVVEALPGGGWYSKILMSYLGHQGKLIGADYAMDMYPKFGFFSEEMLNGKKTWVQSWTTEAKTWGDDQSASVDAFQLGSMPKVMNATADRVVFIRALHNLARFDSDGGYLTAALSDAFNVLKPGGIVGIVQHKAPETATDDWASGSRGYLKQSFLMTKMKNAGFEFVASSDININPKDQPTESDIVWRLPPSLATSSEDETLKNQYLAVGESTRMTLTFRKPK